MFGFRDLGLWVCVVLACSFVGYFQAIKDYLWWPIQGKICTVSKQTYYVPKNWLLFSSLDFTVHREFLILRLIFHVKKTFMHF